MGGTWGGSGSTGAGDAWVGGGSVGVVWLGGGLGGGACAAAARCIVHMHLSVEQMAVVAGSYYWICGSATAAGEAWQHACSHLSGGRLKVGCQLLRRWWLRVWESRRRRRNRGRFRRRWRSGSWRHLDWCGGHRVNWRSLHSGRCAGHASCWRRLNWGCRCLIGRRGFGLR